MLVSLAIAAAALILDQLTKYWAQTSLQAVGDIPLWEGVFHFHYARNTGAAFSILEGQNWLFFIFTAVVVAGMGWYLFRNRKGMHPLVGCILMGIYILLIHDRYTRQMKRPEEGDHGAGDDQPAG